MSFHFPHVFVCCAPLVYKTVIVRSTWRAPNFSGKRKVAFKTNSNLIWNPMCPRPRRSGMRNSSGPNQYGEQSIEMQLHAFCQAPLERSVGLLPSTARAEQRTISWSDGEQWGFFIPDEVLNRNDALMEWNGFLGDCNPGNPPTTHPTLMYVASKESGNCVFFFCPL